MRKYLNIARITGTTSQADQSMSLCCEVLCVELSPKNKVSRHPRPVFARLLGLGKCRQTFVTSLPFVLTWTTEYLYVSMSSEKLWLFRFPLGQSSPSDTAQRTEVLDSDIVLPRSARTRPLHFFPQRNNTSNSVLIIGCQHGDSTDSPMVVYLSAANLGEWKEVDGTVVDPGEYEVQLRDEPLMEDFDEDSDCDLIMYRHEFQ